MPEQLLPPQNPQITPPEHMEGYSPFGAHAVHAEEKRMAEIHKADFYDRAANYTEQFENIPDPRFQGRVRPLVQKILGKEVAGPEVAEWLDANNQGNLSVATQQNRNNAEGIKKYTYLYENARDNTLKSVRMRLHDLDASNKISMNSYLEENAPPIFHDAYAAWKAKGPENKSADMSTWLAHAPKSQFLNFLQWHNHKTEAYNADPEVQKKIELDKFYYVNNLVKLKDAGHLPVDVDSIKQKVDDTKIIVGDIFDTSLRGRSGYHFRDSGQIVISQDSSGGTVDHELNHAVLGSFEDTDFDEAMTEHVTIAMLNGEFTKVHPGLRNDIIGTSTYRARRALLATALEAGTDGGLLPDAVAAYVEADSSGLATVTFNEKLNESFGGIDVYKFIQSFKAEKMSDLTSSNPDYSRALSDEMSLEYAAENLSILGALAKGTDVTDIISSRNTEFDSYSIPEHLKVELRKTNAINLEKQIAAVQAYVTHEKKD